MDKKSLINHICWSFILLYLVMHLVDCIHLLQMDF